MDADGRRPKQWRDELEDMIVGDWEWREGEVSGSTRGGAAPRGTGRYGLVYNFESSRKARRSAEKGDRGVSLSTGVTVKDQFVKWGKEVPQTTVVAHTPGAYQSSSRTPDFGSHACVVVVHRDLLGGRHECVTSPAKHGRERLLSARTGYARS